MQFSLGKTLNAKTRIPNKLPGSPQDPQWITLGSPQDPHFKTRQRPHDMHTHTAPFCEKTHITTISNLSMRYSPSLRVSEQLDTLGEVPAEPFHSQLGIHFFAAAFQTSTILIASLQPAPLWTGPGKSQPHPRHRRLMQQNL